MASVDFLFGNVDKEGQLEGDEVHSLQIPDSQQDLREILDEGDSRVLQDYFSGGFDLGELNKGPKTNGDGPIVPDDDAQDFSDEESLAEDEGDVGGAGEEDIDVLLAEGQVKQDVDDEMDLFGPEMSSQPAGQHFGADTFIALLGPSNDDAHGLQWSDEQHDGMFDDQSPKDTGVRSDDEMDVQEDIFGETPEPRKSAAELVKDWFPQFDPNEIPNFTEIFGSKQAELSRPLAKVPRGMSFLIKA